MCSQLYIGGILPSHQCFLLFTVHCWLFFLHWINWIISSNALNHSLQKGETRTFPSAWHSFFRWVRRYIMWQRYAILKETLLYSSTNNGTDGIYIFLHFCFQLSLSLKERDQAGCQGFCSFGWIISSSCQNSPASLSLVGGIFMGGPLWSKLCMTANISLSRSFGHLLNL